MQYVSEKLPRGARISVLSINADSRELRDYMVVESENHISNNTFLRLVDKNRRSVALQGKDVDNLSGLEEEELLEIGRLIGAEYVVLGEFSKRGEFYRLVIQLLDVETAEIKGMLSTRVVLNELLADLTGVELAPATPVKNDSEDLMKVKEMLAQIDAKLESERERPQQAAPVRQSDPELEAMRKELDELRATVATQQVTLQQQQKKRSRVLMATRTIITPAVDSKYGGVLSGVEYEIGGLKRDTRIISGTMMFVSHSSYTYGYSIYDSYSGRYEDYSEDYFGWGGGVVFAPRIVPAKEFFKFVPAIEMGYWYYLKNEPYSYRDNNNNRIYDTRQDMECYWGGPSFRLMFGYRLVFVDASYRIQFGFRHKGNTYSYYDHYGNYNYDYGYSGFSTRQLWGIGLTFLLGKGNW
jgi:hypothetical protein